MIRSQVTRLLLLLLLIAGSTRALSAQAMEAYIFAGGYGSGNSIHFNDDLFNGDRLDHSMPGGFQSGFTIGGFLDENFELEGTLGWYNHFQLGSATNVEVFRPVANTFVDPKVGSLLWEGSGTWNFGETKVGARFSPYLTLGLGGMTARVHDGDVSSVFVTGGGFIRNPMYITDKSPVPQFIANPTRQIVMDNNDSFFTFSYGGGLKGLKVWGPVGFRFDFRGRTIPNFYGRSLTRPEATGGVVFAWGER